ncbi:hypothetical protein [Mesorhizobium sp. AR10]|uniref:hypothetical protein n=1 Tax=Mesorhizobium sp. AR10 TaxID=2865839 RepID=UPI00215DE049|nr:hypothetical protein [Mesorhizobium sp. AR10]
MTRNLITATAVSVVHTAAMIASGGVIAVNRWLGPMFISHTDPHPLMRSALIRCPAGMAASREPDACRKFTVAYKRPVSDQVCDIQYVANIR